MEIKELYEKIRDNAFTMRRGLANSVSHSQIIERMKNILYPRTGAGRCRA